MYDMMNSIDWKRIAKKGPKRPKGWTPDTNFWLDELKKPWGEQNISPSQVDSTS